MRTISIWIISVCVCELENIMILFQPFFLSKIGFFFFSFLNKRSGPLNLNNMYYMPSREAQTHVIPGRIISGGDDMDLRWCGQDMHIIASCLMLGAYRFYRSYIAIICGFWMRARLFKNEFIFEWKQKLVFIRIQHIHKGMW